MDKFDDFAINKKFKHQAKYVAYIDSLYNYLTDFIKRSRPLFDLQGFQQSFHASFEDRYAQGKIIGWDDN